MSQHAQLVTNAFALGEANFTGLDASEPRDCLLVTPSLPTPPRPGPGAAVSVLLTKHPLEAPDNDWDAIRNLVDHEGVVRWAQGGPGLYLLARQAKGRDETVWLLRVDEAAKNDPRSDQELIEAIEALWDAAQPLETLADQALEEEEEGDVVGAEELVTEAFREINERFANPGIYGAKFGIEELDHLTGGLQAGTLTVIAGRPASGKTALTMAAARLVTGKAPRPTVMVVTNELPAQAWTQRLLAGLAQVDMSKVRTGTMGETEFVRVAEAAGRLSAAALTVIDEPQLTIDDIERYARLGHEPDMLLIVDGLAGMATPGAYKAEDRKAAYGEIAARLKALALELNTPVILTAPLSYYVDLRDDHKPRLTDLNDDGTLADVADAILAIHRPEYYAPLGERQGVADIHMLKNRHGPTGTVEVGFHAPEVRFHAVAKQNR